MQWLIFARNSADMVSLPVGEGHVPIFFCMRSTTVHWRKGVPTELNTILQNFRVNCTLKGVGCGIRANVSCEQCQGLQMIIVHVCSQFKQREIVRLFSFTDTD